MAWFILIVGGLFEVGWATLLDQTERFTRPWPTLGFVATLALSMYLLSLATRDSPIGTALALDGGSPQSERDAAVKRLQAGEITAIFTRDIFNEGIDIPEVDTILLLRPTQSVTVHLQQIGRGLRRHASKASARCSTSSPSTDRSIATTSNSVPSPACLGKR